MPRFFLWLLLTIYAIARLGQAAPESVPVVVTVALHVFVPLAFALFHGSLVYGLRGALRFALTALVIGNIMENVGVPTGVPFEGSGCPASALEALMSQKGAADAFDVFRFYRTRLYDEVI